MMMMMMITLKQFLVLLALVAAVFVVVDPFSHQLMVMASQRTKWMETEVDNTIPVTGDEIETALAKLHFKPGTYLWEMNPKAAMLKDRSDLYEVYQPSFAGETLDIFRQPLVHVAKRFFNNLDQYTNMKDVNERMRIFVENVGHLVDQIEEILSSPNNRYQVGLTSMSALSLAEFKRRLGLRPNKPEVEEEDDEVATTPDDSYTPQQ